MPTLQLTLLGPPAIHVDGQPLSHSLPLKSQALLFYLACHAGPQQRRRVAGTLWPDVDEQAARANLRVALSRVRKSVGDCFDATRQVVSLRAEWPVVDDVGPFLAAVRAEQWPEAARLYGGPFLHGLELIDAAPFAEWLIVERERLHQLAVRALEHELQNRLRAEAWEGSVMAAQRLLAMDPWRESAHRGLMHALAADGRRAAALAQYDLCRTVLANELDIEPAPATTALYAAIRAAKPGTPFALPQTLAAPPREAPALPPAGDKLIGRETELAQLVARLTGDTGRLVTITGLGGSGKTRLALAVAHAIVGMEDSPFPDGVFWISLAAVGDASGMVAAIAGAVGLSFSGAAPPQAQLADFLRFKRLLLVVDNMEHLIAAAEILADLLATGPAVRMLVTSRERLNLGDERHFPLAGLPFAGAKDDTVATPAAFALFLAQAKQVDSSFDVAAEAPAIVTICRLVEGLPLGIKLAASWVHAYPCEEIAMALADQRETLATRTRDVPARHRSLEAAFEHSWQLLTGEEQKALTALAGMPGGFSLDGAQHVAGANWQLLAQLVEKSLVRRRGRRYLLHQLLRQFAWQKGPVATQRAIQRRFVAYLSGFLQAWSPAVTAPDQAEALHAIDQEEANVLHAWQLAIDLAMPEALQRMVHPLAHFFLKRGRQHSGVALFAAATSYVEPLGSAYEPLLATLLVWQGRCAELISKDYSVPEALFERGIALAEQYGLDAVCGQGYIGQAMLAMYRGQYVMAKGVVHRGLEAARASSAPWMEASCLAVLAWLEHANGETLAALANCERALALQRAGGDANGTAATLTTYGIILNALGRQPEAEAAYQEALTITRRNGHRVGQSQALTGLVGLYLRQGQLEQARRFGEESLAVSRDVGNRLGMAIAYHNLGYTFAEDGDHEAAVAAYQSAVAIYAELEADAARRVNTFYYLAQSLLELGRQGAAQTVLCQALAALPPTLEARFGQDLCRLGETLLGRQSMSSEGLAVRLAFVRQRLQCPE